MREKQVKPKTIYICLVVGLGLLTFLLAACLFWQGVIRDEYSLATASHFLVSSGLWLAFIAVGIVWLVTVLWFDKFYFKIWQRKIYGIIVALVLIFGLVVVVSNPVCNWQTIATWHQQYGAKP